MPERSDNFAESDKAGYWLLLNDSVDRILLKVTAPHFAKTNITFIVVKTICYVTKNNNSAQRNNNVRLNRQYCYFLEQSHLKVTSLSISENLAAL